MQQAFNYVKKAEKLAENNDKAKADAYNNLACYYRRIGKLRAALSYLEKTLDIETKYNFTDKKAETHLNMCAVLGQLARHDLAYGHAQNAIILTQSKLLQVFLPRKFENETSDQKR